MKNILSLTLIAMIACPPGVVYAASDAMGNFVSGDEETFAKSGDPLSRLKLAETPFEACQSKTFIPSKLYNEDKEYWDAAKEQCGVQIEVLADTGFFNTMVSKLGGSENDQQKAIQFLKEVGAKTSENIQINIASTKRIVECAETPSAEGCSDVLKSLSKSIEKVRPALRQAQALSAYENAGQSVETSEIQNKLNRFMVPVSPKLVFDAKMEALNESEASDALDKFKDETKEIQKSWDEAMEKRMEQIDAKRKAGSNPGLDAAYADAKAKVGKYDEKKFLDYRVAQRAVKMDKHREDYVANMFKAPILAYLGQDKAAEKCADGDAGACHAVVAAAKKLQANSEAEAKKVAELMNDRVKTGGRAGTTRNKTVSEMIDLMKYGPAVREVLAKNGNYCQSATGLANLVANMDTRNSAYIMGGMIGGFVAGGWAGGAVASALGAGTTAATIIGASAAAVATGGASIYMDAKHVDATEQRVMGHATQDDGKEIGDMKDLVEAKDALAMNIILSPANLLGTGAFKAAGGVGLALAASYQGEKAAARIAASSALRGALKDKGHSEAVITKMFADLQSKDSAVAKKAAEAMIKDLDYDKNQLSVIQAAANKGLISMTTQRAAMKAIKGEIHDAATAHRVLDVLQEVNSAKLNEANRMQVLETAIAGSKFGIKEPKYLAAKINDWEEGLDGLTATFKLAEKKLASVNGDQDKAFRLALREQLEGKVAKEDMESTVEKMATCGIKGK